MWSMSRIFPKESVCRMHTVTLVAVTRVTVQIVPKQESRSLTRNVVAGMGRLCPRPRTRSRTIFNNRPNAVLDHLRPGKQRSRESRVVRNIAVVLGRRAVTDEVRRPACPVPRVVPDAPDGLVAQSAEDRVEARRAVGRRAAPRADERHLLRRDGGPRPVEHVPDQRHAEEQGLRQRPQRPAVVHHATPPERKVHEHVVRHLADEHVPLLALDGRAESTSESTSDASRSARSSSPFVRLT